MRPVRLNLALASLFAIGSACFALGSMPAYANAVGATADSITFFVGSLFFTAASYLQLVQAQTPAMTGVDERSQHVRSPLTLVGMAAARPRVAVRRRPVPRHPVLQHQHPRRAGPQRDGAAAGPARLATGPVRLDPVPGRERARPHGGAGLRAGAVPHVDAGDRLDQHGGSVLFMASALGSYVLPGTGEPRRRPGRRRRHVPRRPLLPRRSRAPASRLARAALHRGPARRPSDPRQGVRHDLHARSTRTPLLFGNRFVDRGGALTEFPDDGMTAVDAMRLVSRTSCSKGTRRATWPPS